MFQNLYKDFFESKIRVETFTEAATEGVLKKKGISQNSIFLKKETLAQVFSCELCEICKNTFFTEHVRMTASTFGILISFFRPKSLRKVNLTSIKPFSQQY